MKPIINLYALALFLLCALTAKAGTGYDLLPQYADTVAMSGSFCLASPGSAATIIVDDEDWKGVKRAAADLADDIRKVTGIKPEISSVMPPCGAVIIGTIGKSRIIDGMVAAGKLNVEPVRGQWESFLIETVDGNLVVAGADKRGTIYGIYDISEKIGVSPWYFWADVPVAKAGALYIKEGRYVMPSPKVKYRGIFINDEWPSFGGWCNARFGGINSKMYATMFELLLRLKANYLWPAMWASAFNEDDPLCPQVADDYGIVMGTSHHEPMMRAHKEYKSRREKVGPWDYTVNSERLDSFFREGIARNKNFENIITIGMRGDGDTHMGKGDDRENMRTLTDVVDGQRKIIAEEYGCKPSEVPQLWAIFTEVQRYYDAGFKVPDDVTLLFCDNNWGFIRRTGPEKERKRSGGMGLYYHIDMNGGPANDRWVNTTTPAKLREQLNLAYSSGIDRIWIINVGDLKPKEMPIDFILRYAWNPDSIGVDDTRTYLEEWAQRIFGAENAPEIADIVFLYSNYNLMRKAEVQNPNTFSVVNYNEADSMLLKWRSLADRARLLEPRIAPEARDAYYQLVYYPAVASAGVAEIYLDAAKNNLYAEQGRVSANSYADRAAVLFEDDRRLSDIYNLAIAGGKWKNMMSDNHIGYKVWSMPKQNELPPMQRVVPLEHPAMGVAVSGSKQAWPVNAERLLLPMFEPLGCEVETIEVFNRGTGSFSWTASASEPWIDLSKTGSTISDTDESIGVSVDWSRLPEGLSSGVITIDDGTQQVSIAVTARNYPLPQTADRYFGSLGEFSVPATLFSANCPGSGNSWTPSSDHGRGFGCMLAADVSAPSSNLRRLNDAPTLEYDIYLPADTALTVAVGILPTQDVAPARGLRFGIALDNGPVAVVDARKSMSNEFREYTPENLALSKCLKPLPTIDKPLTLRGNGADRRSDTFDNLRWVDSALGNANAGLHKIKIVMIDPEIVVERLVVNPDNARYSYNGAPPRPHDP